MRLRTIALILWVGGSSVAQGPPFDPPWKAVGRVTDPEGHPMAGVSVWASTGRGTLRRSGTTTSGEDGRYELKFGPGVFLHNKEASGLQAAIIGAHQAGFFEENLNRQGGCTAADGEPTDDQIQSWKTRRDRVFVPGKPIELNFVMRPAGQVSGRLVSEQGQPMAGYSVALTGPALSPGSSVWASTIADDQGRFRLEDIPTTERFQIVVRKADPKPPWDDSWASAGLRFMKPESGDLRAWFGTREIRLENLVVRMVGPGMHDRNALPTAANLGKLELTGEPTERGETFLSAKSATLTLQNSAKPNVRASLIPDFSPMAPSKPSPTGLARTRPDADGEFTIRFQNPEGFDLTAEKHQVIFEVSVGRNPVRERIFRQIAVKPGRYEERVRFHPDWIDEALVSITFVTIQPDHDRWVRAFFLEGKGTNYSGIWTADGNILPAISIESPR